MADLKKRLPNNTPGEFYVDSTCINCDTCRQLAPEVFEDSGPYSYVQRQPGSELERRKALQALLACPTHSIGTQTGHCPKEALDDFPLLLEEPVYYMGFNSTKSYGGNSYLLRSTQGNWLVDSPQFLSHLVNKLEAWGGLKYVFLTHQDDVADADKYAKHFSAKRIIHQADASAAPHAEIKLQGDQAVEIEPGFTIIPSPGHTRGHTLLLAQNRFLFTGDHLAWDRASQQLDAWRDYCWYSWQEQTRSMHKLKDYSFEWVLPGHGQRVKLPASEMRQKLLSLLEQMQR